MSEEAEIPCATCPSWTRKEKKFSCKPDECKGLTKWLQENAPQLRQKPQAKLPEIATQYVV